MIVTLLITAIVEALIALGFCARYQKPVLPILSTSVAANLVTQFLLWSVLRIFFQHYLTALLISEVLIWFLEGSLLYFVPENHLKWTESMLLSLTMNVVSFALGWFLPV